MANTDLVNEGLLADYHDELMKTHLAGGVVFDISAYNLTNGQPTPYADLAAALGTNGANVPEPLRKGGMSVKFVQSSDHKYVQYRLMSDSFNTITSNWQGVDDEPQLYSSNLLSSGGVAKSLSGRLSVDRIDMIRDILSQYLCSVSDSLSVVDKNGKVIMSLDKDTLSTVNVFVKSKVIADFFEENGNSVYVIDKSGYIMAVLSVDGLKVTNIQLPEGFSLNDFALTQKELFVVGDSLSAGGVWENEATKVCGCAFDQEKNSLPGYQISTGGTITYGGGKDSGLVRITNIKKKNYNPGIILLQNSNDKNAFNNDGTPISGNINDAPVIINQIIEGNALADWNNDAATLLANIPAAERMFGTSLQLLYSASGKNLKINTAASVEGDIIIQVTMAQTGSLNYSVHVLSTDSISDIINKILENNYTMVTDVPGVDGVSIDFTTGNASYPCTVVFNGNGTGVTAAVTDTDSAQTSIYKIFNGENLTTDWVDPAKWNADPTFFASWKGMIEYAKINWPTALVALLLFPDYYMNPADYMNTDGTFNQEAYNATRVRVNACYAAQREIAEMYNLPVIDIHDKCGITVGNYSAYYYNNNVHPKNDGYRLFGRMIAKEMLSLI